VTILEQILAKKREELALLRERPPLARPVAWDKRSLVDALRRPSGGHVRVLAEVKRASPSAGPIKPDADPVAVAREYADGGAAAISVLTDRTFFAGDPGFLELCHAAVQLPILRKDFLIDPLQLFEAAVLGADAVLLIVAALRESQLHAMLREAKELGLQTLVEVHDARELDVAVAGPYQPDAIGVNHRNLHTFAIDMSLTEEIARRVPAGTVLVAESGIKTADDVRRLGDAGAHAVLVGEHLMRAPSPGAALRELLRW
jgi:indole-3-glycerol phosphate synthase